MNPYFHAALLGGHRFPENGLVSYLQFDNIDKLNDSYIDQSQYGNNVTTFNNPTNTVGKFGECIQFSSPSSQWASASNSPSLDITSSFTITCWINYTSLPVAGQFPNVVGKFTDFTGYGLYYNGASSALFGQIGFGGNWYNTELYHIPINTWTQITVRFRYPEFSLWVDGVNTGDRMVYGYPQTNAASLVYNRHYGSAVYGFGSCLLDEVRIYNRALTDSELLSLKP